MSGTFGIIFALFSHRANTLATLLSKGKMISRAHMKQKRERYDALANGESPLETRFGGKAAAAQIGRETRAN